jgi:hypothetical protein
VDAEGELPPPLDKGTDPIHPSDPVPIQGISGASSPASESDYSAEMAGSQPGELRGFTDGDESSSYILTGDGAITSDDFVDYVTGKESQATQDEQIAQETAQPLATSSFVDSDHQDSESPTMTQEEIIPSAADRRGRSTTASGISSATDSDGSTVKTIGNVSSQGSGLPIDDDIEGDTSDDNGDDSSDAPPPIPESGSGTGVSPNLPGTDPAGGEGSGSITGLEAIGTWPTPQETAVGTGPSESIDANDVTRSEERNQVTKLMSESLPEGSDDFTDKASAEIVKGVLADVSDDILTPVRVIIQNEYQNLSELQTEGMLALTLVKAAQTLETIKPDLKDNRVVADSIQEKMAEVAQQVAEEAKAGAESTKDLWKMALKVIREAEERRQQNIKKLSSA